MVKKTRDQIIAAADRALANDESSDASLDDSTVRVGKRGPYKTMKGKPVMTPEQRKKAKAERDKRYKQRQRTEAAKLRAQMNKDFAKLIMSAPMTIKESKLAVK